MYKGSSILRDAITYFKMSKNNNYKDRLIEAYNLIKENNIKSLEDFEYCNLGIGAFEYSEITIFDRLKDINYSVMLSQFVLELESLENMDIDYGDQLASYGTVGKTPYRKKYLNQGLIKESKTKFYR